MRAPSLCETVFSWLALAGAMALAAGCASYTSAARDEFVRSATCPAGRVSVTRSSARPAPPDIAADPQRLALWNQEAERRAESWYVARGCGQERRYRCEMRYERTTPGEQSQWPSCTEVGAAPGP